MQYTEEQLKVIKAHRGNNLVNASSGSGKSSVVIANIVDLIKNEGVDPSEILVLSFSNTAADSIKQKLKHAVGNKANTINAMTMHSFAYSQLKKASHNEYSNKSIVKSWFQLDTATNLVKEADNYNEYGLDISLLPGQLLQFISYQKANMVFPKDNVIINDETDYVKDISRDKLQRAYDNYCKILYNAKSIDFDDMLLDFYDKLRSDSEFVNVMKNKYKYILVDEAQDTSRINMEILKLISNNNLLFVGDFRQGIYSFNNSSIDNILNFHKEFDNVNIYELSYNFRSTDKIVKISNNIIAKSPDERYKSFKEQIGARHVNGEDVDIVMYNSEHIEAEDIVQKVEDLIDNGVDMNDIAILHRTNNGLLLYESMFSSLNIPVRLSGGSSFYDRNEIVDLMAYLRLSYAEDDSALRRIYNRPNRYLSNNLLYKLDEYATNNNISLEHAMRNMPLKGRERGNINRLLNSIDDIRDKSHLKCNRIIKNILRITNYEGFMKYKSSTRNDLYLKLDAIDRFISDSESFVDPNQFLGYISSIKRNSKTKHKEAVNLMTVHASKGLEYDYVFVTGVHNNNFPHKMDGNNYEESRRLLYVAVSRAKNHLQVSIPVNQETIQSDTNEQGDRLDVSPFLLDIDVDGKLFDAKKNVSRGNRFEVVKYG